LLALHLSGFWSLGLVFIDLPGDENAVVEVFGLVGVLDIVVDSVHGQVK
jgi:hypothetical protein